MTPDAEGDGLEGEDGMAMIDCLKDFTALVIVNDLNAIITKILIDEGLERRLEGCLLDCLGSKFCTSINFDIDGPIFCVLKACEFPVPKPLTYLKGSEGYYLTSGNLKENS